MRGGYNTTAIMGYKMKEPTGGIIPAPYIEIAKIDIITTVTKAVIIFLT